MSARKAVQVKHEHKGWQEAGLSNKGQQPHSFADASMLPADGERPRAVVARGGGYGRGCRACHPSVELQLDESACASLCSSMPYRSAEPIRKQHHIRLVHASIQLIHLTIWPYLSIYLVSAAILCNE